MAVLRTITGTVTDAQGVPARNATVLIQLSQPTTIPGSQEIVVSTIVAATDQNGKLIMPGVGNAGPTPLQLLANADQTPTGTYYNFTVVPQYGERWAFPVSVPNTGPTFELSNIMTGGTSASPTPSHVASMTIDGALTVGGTTVLGVDPGGAQLLRVGGTSHLSGLLTLDGGITVTAGAVTLPAASVADAALSTNVALLAGAQAFTGVKTFTANPVFNAGGIPIAAVSGAAQDSLVVHLAGAETVTGAKTFSGGITVSGGAVSFPAASIAASMVGAIPESQVTNLTSDLAAKAADSLVVHLAGAETVSGLKTFSAAPPANANAAAVQLGNGVFGGGAGTFAGSASGTVLGLNTPSAYTGDLFNFQQGGLSALALSARSSDGTSILTANSGWGLKFVQPGGNTLFISNTAGGAVSLGHPRVLNNFVSATDGGLAVMAITASSYAGTAEVLPFGFYYPQFSVASSYATQRGVLFSAPTFSGGAAVTLGTAATVEIAGAPTASGGMAITNPYALRVFAGAATGIPIVVQGAASQTADLQRWLKSDGSVLASISAAGAPTFAQPITLPMSNGIVIGNAAGNTYMAFSGGQGWYWASAGTQLFYVRGAGGPGTGSVEVITNGLAAGNDFAAFQVDAGTIIMNVSPAASGVVRLKQVTYSSAAAQTAAAAATLIIEGPPIAGTNYTITKPLALWAQAGGAQFDGGIGLNGSAPVGKQTLTGAKGGNAALASVIAALVAMGAVLDNTTA